MHLFGFLFITAVKQSPCVKGLIWQIVLDYSTWRLTIVPEHQAAQELHQQYTRKERSTHPRPKILAFKRAVEVALKL